MSVLGVPSLNFAFADGVELYHTSHDDVAHLNPGSVQHHGNQMLGLVRVFASDTLDVILDRRLGERRSDRRPVTVERRRGDRRGPTPTTDLEKDVAHDLRSLSKEQQGLARTRSIRHPFDLVVPLGQSERALVEATKGL